MVSGSGSSGSGRGTGIAIGVLVLVLAGATVAVLRGVLSPPAQSRGVDGATAGSGESAQSAREEAMLLVQRGEYTRGAAVLERAVERWPEDQELRIAYMHALLGLERHRDAYRQAEAALAIGPELPQLHFDAGTVASLAGMHGRAEEHYAMAQAADPSEPRYPLYLGMVQIRQGRAEEGAASLLRAANLNPELAPAWGTLAEVYLEQNKLGVARQMIDRARALQPDVGRWRIVEARIVKRQGDAERAAMLLQGLDASELRRDSVMRLLAECYGMLGRPGRAAEMYADAFRASPEDPGLAYEAALWYERAGDAGRAARYARSASMMGHGDGAALYRRLGGD